MGYIQFHTDGNGDDIPPSDAYVLGFVQGEQVYAVFDTDETNYYSCSATNERYREEHLSDWISDGNVDAVKSSFPDWIAENQIDPTLEVKNEIVAQVTIQGYLPVIAPDGDVQIFANAECTRYATGMLQTVYARVNRTFAINQATEYGSPDNWKEYCSVFTPSTEYPDDSYGVLVWIDWNGTADALQSGDVIECVNATGAADVTDCTKVFS